MSNWSPQMEGVGEKNTRRKNGQKLSKHNEDYELKLQETQ